MVMQRTVSAVVLTGGRSSRLGGRHKPGILVGGQSIIDQTLHAVWHAAPLAEIVVAGSDEGLSADLRQRITVVREEPPFSGPTAGVAAAVDALPPSNGVVLVLGGDLPFLSSATIRRLMTAVADDAPVASCRDAAGQLQYLCSGWQQQALRERLTQLGDPANMPLHALFAGHSPTVIECHPDELRDIDSPEDLAWARRTADTRSTSGSPSAVYPSTHTDGSPETSG